MVSILVAFIISAAPPQGPASAELLLPPQTRSDLDSELFEARAIAAMALPYRYGVTQMPCRAQEWQPQRGWYPAREPSGKIQWIVGGDLPRVRWSGIYGTCFIQTPAPREALSELERTSLECECNGWLPRR